MRALGRLAVILCGFIGAVLVAGVFASFLLIGSLGWADTAPFAFEGPIYIFYFIIVGIFGFLTFFPALVAIVLAEMLRAKDWLFYAVAGAMIAAFSAILEWRNSADPVFYEGDVTLLLGLVGCGIVGGMAYWAIAGRSSGLWRD